MVKLFVIFVLLLLTGCSTYKPLNGEPSNGAYGYVDKKLTANQFLVRVHGRNSESYQDLRVKLVKRASELCSGSFVLSNYTKKQGFVVHAKRVHWPYVDAHLECTEEAIDQSVLFENDS